MVTFFVIFVVLIVVNAGLLISSSLSNRKVAYHKTKRVPTNPEIKIYPMDLLPSDYKKAI